MENRLKKIEIAKMSSKGQLVIPQDIREKMHMTAGSMFAVASVDNTLVLKKIESPIGDEDLKTMKRVDEAWADIEKGNYRKQSKEDFLKELEAW